MEWRMLNTNNSRPFGFKRVTEAFNEIARARICSESSNNINTSSSGISCSSDHHHDYSLELSELVESFIEQRRNHEEDKDEEDPKKNKKQNHQIIKLQTKYDNNNNNNNNNYEETAKSSTSEDDDDDDDDVEWFVPAEVVVVVDTKEMLQKLLGCNEKDQVKLHIRAEIELAFINLNNSSSSSSQALFKRQLVRRLCDRGFDSGLCKSHWEKMRGFPCGEYEYVDVIMEDGSRYIVEVSLAGEFSIARPTNHYLTLLNEFPQIFVGKAEELKQVVMLMCAAAKESLKNRDMHLPPWRRNTYMEAKWFGSNYKRINNTSLTIDNNNNNTTTSTSLTPPPPPPPPTTTRIHDDAINNNNINKLGKTKTKTKMTMMTSTRNIKY